MWEDNWNRSVCVIFRREINEKKEKLIYNSDCSIKGTGFFLNIYDKFILVTAKHVIQNKETKKIYDKLAYGYNEYNADGTFIPVARDLDSVFNKHKTKWYFHPNAEIDLAATIVELIPNNFPILNQDSLLRYDDLDLATDIYHLGYPLGLIGSNDISPVIDKGIISRKIINSTELPYGKLNDKTILTNCFLDAGYSGSPLLIVIDENEQGKSKELKVGGIVLKQYNQLVKQETDNVFQELDDGIHFADIRRIYFLKGKVEVLPIDYLLDILKTDDMKKEFEKK